MNVHVVITRQGNLIGVYASAAKARRIYDEVKHASPSQGLFLIERELNEEPE